MDYDRSDIPTVYDEARTLTPQRLRQCMDLLSAYIEREMISLILDLGCGTGRFSEPLARHFSARVVAIDPSQKMLDQARQKLGSTSITWLRGSAEALPLHDDSVDLVFMSMVYHHFTDRALVVKECRRVLRDGGYVCVRNSTREADFPEKHFFPAILPMIDSELPDRKDVVRAFVTAGFSIVVHEIVRQDCSPNWPSFVRKSSLRADSFLARIPDEAFNAGMAELRLYGAEINPDEAVTEEIDWFVFRKRD